MALSSHTLDQNNESYSHDHPYPLQQRFFVEPKSARGAIKCDVAVATNSTEKLASVLVLPYSPTSKDTTPEPIPSTGPPSPVMMDTAHPWMDSDLEHPDSKKKRDIGYFTSSKKQ